MEDLMNILVCYRNQFEKDYSIFAYYSKDEKLLKVLFTLFSGGIVVGISAKGARLQHWIDMIKHPGQTTTQTHFLSAAFVD